MKKRRLLFLLAGLLGGCYQPDLPDGKFKCASTSECPPGFTCSMGLCRTSPAAGGGDGAAAPPACRLGGEPLGQGSVHACRGSFNPMAFTEPCGAAYHVCDLGRSADVSLLAALNGASCPSGFYGALGTLILRGSDRQEARCDQPRQGDISVIVGCGSEDGTIGLRGIQLCSSSPLNQISALRSGYACGAQSQAWSCATGLTDATHRSGDRGGVLCCAN
jgi:hypothetical protein